jgi:hypothetical protein
MLIFSLYPLARKTKSILFIRLATLLYLVKKLVSLPYEIFTTITQEILIDQIDLKYVAIESALDFERHVYSHMVEKLIIHHNVKSMSTFEMVGKYHFTDYKTSLRNNLQSRQFQLYFLKNNYLPFRQLFSEIHAGNADIKNKIESKSITTNENIRVELHDRNLKKLDRKDLSNVLLFATQPYDIESTIRFLKKLKFHIKENNYNILITLRIHPRDKKTHYGGLNIKFADSGLSFIDLLYNLKPRLVLTRTSSIVDECKSLNIPFANIALSDLDNKDLANNQLSSSTLEDLKAMLSEIK